MSDKPLLLWHSNAPWTPTGYGQQTALFCKRLKEHYDLAISAYYGLEGNALPWNGIPVLPGMSPDHGDRTIRAHANAKFGEDKGIVLTLMDVWVLDPNVWSKLDVCSWVPVDHEPVPGPVKAYFTQTGAIPIAMSKFGQEQLADLDPLYVPHAVDTEAFHPVNKRKAREATNMPQEAFIVGMVAANKGNPSRKCFPEAFLAFKAFKEKHPEAVLYLHTELTGSYGGVDLPKLLHDVGVSDVISCDQYRAVHLPFNDEAMANTYSSMDVLLMPSAGEGFGIPAIEAQACGVPVIVSDFSAQPELCGAGWLVEGDPTYTAIGSWQVKPRVESIVDALEKAYDPAPNMPESAREFALDYDIETVLEEHMLPALNEVEVRFGKRAPVALEAVA